MVKKWFTSKEYTHKYQEKLFASEKLKKIHKQGAERRVLQAMLKLYRKTVVK